MPVSIYPSTVGQRVFIGAERGVMCPRDFRVMTVTEEQHANDTAVPCSLCGLMLRGYGDPDADPPEYRADGFGQDL